MRKSIDVHERLPFFQMVPLGLQHLFAMFGATVLVPILTGLSPAVALFTSGTGTLIFIFITQGKVPAYLGSSFAFIAPITAVAAAHGLPYALGGGLIVGIIYGIVAFFISRAGTGWLDRMLPPVVIGSIIIVIGLGLAPTAVSMAGLAGDNVSIANVNVQIALFTLLVTVIGSVVFKGFLAVIPILIGIVAGYIFAVLRGAVDFTVVSEAAWFGLPNFMLPKFSWAAITMIAPVALVTIAEHLGDVLVLSKITGRDFYKNPGLARTLLGDGIASSWAALWGGPPNTTYGENVGVMAITKVYSVWVIGLAGIFAVLLSFIPKAEALISTIPEPVMGGVSMVLFGVIASSGLRTLVESGIDYSNKRNLIISSVILTLGIGGAGISAGAFKIQGMALSAVVGILMNLLLPRSIENQEQRARN
ncbi:MAG TPA: uracil permease [Firmicutes bacterium]|jgi:uracil permease|nr:uracil permease [Bacillota bacterium]